MIKKLAFLAGDALDMATVKRMKSLCAGVGDVGLYAFTRTRYQSEQAEYWPTVSLGEIANRRYGQRVIKLLAALIKLVRHREELRRFDVLYARALDMALLAVLTKGFVNKAAVVAYEVLDIPPVLTKKGWRGVVARSIERWVIRRTSLIVVSSPAYVREFYAAVQGYQGPWRLLENKLSEDQIADSLPTSAAQEARSAARDGWVLGWFGTLRSEQSLRSLVEVTNRLPGIVWVRLHGVGDTIGEETLRQTIERSPYVDYLGPYNALHDLPALYREVDFVWCGDLDRRVANDSWLLPNRVYEAGYFGVPVLAVAGTETARYVERNGLGWVLDDDRIDTIASFFRDLTAEQYQMVRKKVREASQSEFVGDGQMAEILSCMDEIVRAQRESRSSARTL